MLGTVVVFCTGGVVGSVGMIVDELHMMGDTIAWCVGCKKV